MDNQWFGTGEPVGREMSVAIPGQEKRLKEEQTGSPDGRRPAKLGKQSFTDQQLNQEKKNGVDKQGNGDQPDHGKFSERMGEPSRPCG